MEKKDKRPSGGVSASFVTGAVALVLLIVGYQIALFLNKAAVSKVLAARETPDTVYVVDDQTARRVLLGQGGSASADRDGGAGGTGKVGGGSGRADGTGKTGRGAVGDGGSRGTGGTGGADGAGPGGESVVVTVRGNRAAEVVTPVAGYDGRRQPRRTENFPFDPNVVGLDDLQRLGFSQKQAQSILNYRERGGRFRRKTDFAKSFVVADSVYRRLEPYIVIPKVDLNRADSSDFDTLPGIGGYFAARMVEYRSRLGGYSYVEQLMDIRNFDREKFEGLANLVTVDPAYVRPYRLWTLPEDSLKLHPYIGSYSAHGVVLYRENSPRQEWSVEALVGEGIISPDNAPKLLRCRIEEP